MYREGIRGLWILLVALRVAHVVYMLHPLDHGFVCQTWPGRGVVDHQPYTQTPARQGGNSRYTRTEPVTTLFALIAVHKGENSTA